ncbi:MAG TPA: nuclear transport factor 2 family protein [Prolixibacteraceae bacterium]|nr:nuclear transport factor 2 family protein [Prolixibacteraceae bacterium]
MYISPIKQNEMDIHPNNRVPDRLPLTIETIKTLWSKTYNTEGKPDWSHIYPYYHKDILFQDTIQRIEGIDAFIAMTKRLTARTQQLNMEIVSIAQNDRIFLFDWIMTMMFKKYPSTPLYGSTKLVTDEEGFIVGQRDYYDLWGDIFNNIPRFNKMYRRFLIRKFG